MYICAYMNMYIYIHIHIYIYIYVYIQISVNIYMCYIEQEACDYIRVAHVHLNRKISSYFRKRALPKQGPVSRRDRAQQFETELPRHARSACPTKGVKSLSTPRHLVILRTLFVTLQLPHVWFSCVTSINACHAYEWVMSHIHFKHVVTRMNESCHTYQGVMSHSQMSHTYPEVMSRIWLRRITHITEACHTYEYVTSHMWISHITDYEWVMSHVWLSHVNMTKFEWTRIKNNGGFTLEYPPNTSSFPPIAMLTDQDQKNLGGQKTHGNSGYSHAEFGIREFSTWCLWKIRERDSFNVRRDSFICVSWLIHVFEFADFRHDVCGEYVKWIYTHVFGCVCVRVCVCACVSLWRTATRYTLRRIATHCETLQRNATRCSYSTPEHTATHGSARQLKAIRCNTMQHAAAHCNALQQSATQISIHAKQRSILIATNDAIIGCVRNINHSYVQHKSLIREPWPIHMCNVSPIVFNPMTRYCRSHVAHLNEACRTYQWFMLHTRMSHVAHTMYMNV